MMRKNGAKEFKAFDSIAIQNYPHELMELIVDNDSSDNTLSLAMEFAQRLISPL